MPDTTSPKSIVRKVTVCACPKCKSTGFELRKIQRLSPDHQGNPVNQFSASIYVCVKCNMPVFAKKPEPRIVKLCEEIFNKFDIEKTNTWQITSKEVEAHTLEGITKPVMPRHRR